MKPQPFYLSTIDEITNRSVDALRKHTELVSTKTARELYTDLTEKFTANELECNAELQELYQYLADRCKTLDGNYIPTPKREMQKLINKYLLETVNGRVSC